jgi:hypothetical protein
VTYTYTMTTATTANTLTAVTMTVPPGTAGTPAVSVAGAPGATVTLSGNVLTVTPPGGALYVGGGTYISISISGLTNTTVTGTYTSQLVTVGALNGGVSIPLDSGSSGSVTLS